jgi:hypothetical protein
LHQPKAGGDHRDYFNSLTFLIICIFNITNLLLNGEDIIGKWYYYIPFALLSMLIIYQKTSKITKSIMFILLGVFYHIAIDDPSTIGATSFFVLAFLQHENIKYGFFVLLVSLLSITIKSSAVGDTPSQIVLSIGAFTFIYGNFYKIINEYKSKIKGLEQKLKEKNKRKPVIRNIDILNIKEEQKAIIKMHCSGYSYEYISEFLKLNVVPKTVRRKIAIIMKENNIESDAHFGQWLFQRV